MIASKIELYLSGLSASQVSEYISIAILSIFGFALLCLMARRLSNFVVYTPALLTSLGIFGTFTGIVIGLLAFDPGNIDGSIEGLLEGLKTAFLTSLLGIILSIIFKIIQTIGIFSPSDKNSGANLATPEDILEAIKQQGSAIDSLIRAIGSDSNNSILRQLKLLHDDINNNQNKALKIQQESTETLNSINGQLTAQSESFSHFSDTLWIKMQDFADMLSKSATETVIEALKQVITDFNNNLTEQFGENFKQLNQSVKALLIWQENYKQQIEQMTEHYQQGVNAISATEASVLAISNEAKVIPQTMTDLKQVMEVNQHQLSELENHLEAFKDMRDKAVEAVPEIRKQIDETVNTLVDSVDAANKHYETLLTESDKYIQKHINTSNDLLDKFVTNTKDGVDTIGLKLVDSAIQVEKVIAEGAEEFTNKVHQTNDGLQKTANDISSQSEVIKDHLKDTVTDLNNHVRDMINTLVEDSTTLATPLTDANKALVTDTSNVRDGVVQSIDNMQKRLESSLEDVFSSQTQHMNKVFANIDTGLKEQVGKTGTAVEKQLSMIDQSMQQELNQVMNTMGKALGQISNQFVNDYAKLVKQMDAVVKQVA